MLTRPANADAGDYTPSSGNSEDGRWKIGDETFNPELGSGPGAPFLARSVREKWGL
jgi:hypothetical protein